MNSNDLSDGDFEELTFDLLVAIGFVNVNWRRGTGLGGATADQGRDIVAQESRKFADGGEHLETWFVQCKHYTKGVPPEKLQDALAWANSERPNVLLFVASNFLSNSAKNNLENYERNNAPSFRIRTWERKDIERLLSSHPALVRKYNLDPTDPTRTAHPAHLLFVLMPPFNTLPYFFEKLEEMNASTRDSVFSWSYHAVVEARFREPKHGKEKLADLMIDRVDFQAFKAKLLDLERIGVSSHFLVTAAVTDALSWTWRLGDESQVPKTIARHRRAIATTPDEVEAIRGIITTSKESIASAYENQKKAHKNYLYLCESLVPALAMEEMIHRQSLSVE